MKTTILKAVALSIAFSTSAFAGVRCGSQVIDVGASYYNIKQACNIQYEFKNNNSNADFRSLYFVDGGMTYELVVVDGLLTEINMTRIPQ